jgi:hypothetical protein
MEITMNKPFQAWCLITVVLGTGKVEIGELWFEASPGKKLGKPYSKQEAKHSGYCL